jgi:hypothetical protein
MIGYVKRRREPASAVNNLISNSVRVQILTELNASIVMIVVIVVINPWLDNFKPIDYHIRLEFSCLSR